MMRQVDEMASAVDRVSGYADRVCGYAAVKTGRRVTSCAKVAVKSDWVGKQRTRCLPTVF